MNLPKPQVNQILGIHQQTKKSSLKSQISKMSKCCSTMTLEQSDQSERIRDQIYGQLLDESVRLEHIEEMMSIMEKHVPPLAEQKGNFNLEGFTDDTPPTERHNISQILVEG